MPAGTAADAEAVSAALYKLTRPDDSYLQGTTRYLMGWRVTSGGVAYLLWDMALVLPVHPERGPDTAATVAAYVKQGKLTPASAQALSALVAERTGATVTLGEITPPEWTALMRPDSDAAVLFPPPPAPMGAAALVSSGKRGAE
jgi:hypothetical protein